MNEKTAIASYLRYWYGNGCLKPTMMTVFVAIDKCTKSNGCLKVCLVPL